MSSRIGSSNYRLEATRKGHNRKLSSCQIRSEDGDTYSKQCVHILSSSSSNESLLKWPTLFIESIRQERCCVTVIELLQLLGH